MKRRKLPCPAWSDWGDMPPAYGRAMRGMRYPEPSFADAEARNGFVRGFIAAGLIAATGAGGKRRRETLRVALQSGTAMAAGISAANALDRRDYGSALVSVAAGAAGLSAINYLLPKPLPSERETIDEQEKA